MIKFRVDKYVFTLVFYLLVITNPLKGQNITKRLIVKSGGSVSFTVNTIKDYSTGKELNSWTRLNVFFLDTIHIPILPDRPNPGDGASTGWEILVRANQDKLYSDDGSLDLPLSRIRISISAPVPPGVTPSPAITLSNVDQTIATGLDTGNSFFSGEIVISYDCGKTLQLLGEEPEIYSTDLVFTIKELP